MTNLPADYQHTRISLGALTEEGGSSLDTLDCLESHGLVSPARSACVSPASSNGGVYSVSTIRVLYCFVNFSFYPIFLENKMFLKIKLKSVPGSKRYYCTALL